MDDLKDDDMVIKVVVGKDFNKSVKKATEGLGVECEFSSELASDEMIVVTDDGVEHLCKLSWIN